jgi:hypothetical protein
MDLKLAEISKHNVMVDFPLGLPWGSVVRSVRIEPGKAD